LQDCVVLGKQALEARMQIIVAILSFASLMWAEAAGAQSASYSASVSAHNNLPLLSVPDVQKILADASKMLQKGPGHVNTDNNRACNVTLTLKEPTVRSFAAPSEIVDQNNIDAMHNVHKDVDGDFHVKVVKEIRFCRPGLAPGLQGGCAFSPTANFRSMIVIHPADHAGPDHLLWAHEFGHLTGSPHRFDDPLALMVRCPVKSQFSGIDDTRVRVNRDECGRLLAGPGVQSPFVGGNITCQP
jgi:hypothetical protein